LPVLPLDIEYALVDKMCAPRNSAAKLVLVGDVEKAFYDPQALTKLACRHCHSIAEAVDVASSSRDESQSALCIGIVLSGLPGDLNSALETLRRCNSRVTIILLAQMYEEPVAMQLTSPTGRGAGAADDYVICPVTAECFCQKAVAVALGTAQPAPPALLDARIAGRIRQLEKLATEDDLTGLKNRRYIWEFAKQIIERTRTSGGQVTLLLFDIDNLKSFNDAYGHLAGDRILKQAAALMRRCCRAHDVVARIGGDEFAVIFWGAPDATPAARCGERRSGARPPKEAISIAKRFRAELRKGESQPASGLLGPDAKGTLTISGGLASFPHDGLSIDELFRKADRALLEAKRSGKNKIYLVGGRDSDIADIK